MDVLFAAGLFVAVDDHHVARVAEHDGPVGVDPGLDVGKGGLAAWRVDGGVEGPGDALILLVRVVHAPVVAQVVVGHAVVGAGVGVAAPFLQHVVANAVHAEDLATVVVAGHHADGGPHAVPSAMGVLGVVGAGVCGAGSGGIPGVLGGVGGGIALGRAVQAQQVAVLVLAHLADAQHLLRADGCRAHAQIHGLDLEGTEPTAFLAGPHGADPPVVDAGGQGRLRLVETVGRVRVDQGAAEVLIVVQLEAVSAGPCCGPPAQGEGGRVHSRAVLRRDEGHRLDGVGRAGGQAGFGVVGPVLHARARRAGKAANGLVRFQDVVLADVAEAVLEAHRVACGPDAGCHCVGRCLLVEAAPGHEVDDVLRCAGSGPVEGDLAGRVAEDVSQAIGRVKLNAPVAGVVVVRSRALLVEEDDHVGVVRHVGHFLRDGVGLADLVAHLPTSQARLGDGLESAGLGCGGLAAIPSLDSG